jgi:Zn-dependent M28 family amino/carboxypeptidase
MRNSKKLIVSLLSIFLFLLLNTGLTVSSGADKDLTQHPKQDKNYEITYASLSSEVSKENIQEGVYRIAQDPLPRRVLNYTLPGHELSTLDEADAWIEQKLKSWGYPVERDETRVRAFGRDLTKNIHHQYATPPAEAPYYLAHNIMAIKKGLDHPEKVIIVIAHKDSQSWIASPGANDNAVGTCGAMELARILSSYRPRHTIRIIFCNEEHTPWTSVTAAQNMKAAGAEVLALINMDGIGAKSPEQAGHLTNVTRYTTPEGERLADLMINLNDRFSIGLEVTKYLSQSPGDDDGSFINAGFPWSVLNIGSMPYGDPNYHLETDTADKVDYENAKRTVQLTLAFVLYLDMYGRP